MADRKPILCIDFDGVIHSYDKGWGDGSIYGSVVPGFFEWAEKASEHFRLTVYSSRSKEPNGIIEMHNWLTQQRLATGVAASVPFEIEFAYEKPPAFLTIDDRGLRFEGNWADPALDPATLLQFKPWNTR